LLEANRVSEESFRQDVARYNKAVVRIASRNSHLSSVDDMINKMCFDTKPNVRAQRIEGYNASLAVDNEEIDALEEDLKQIKARFLQRGEENIGSYRRASEAALEIRRTWLKLLDHCNEVPGN
jgi:hypothetical protein